MDFEGFIDECEIDIREGQSVRVGRKLADLAVAQVPREWRLPVANLCRRCNLIEKGLALLQPLVRPPGLKSLHSEARAGDIAEYAALLLRVSAIDEASELLSGVSPADEPKVELYRAYSHFARWDMAAARASLRSFLKQDLSDYLETVGRVNLAATLIDDSSARAECLDILNGLIAKTGEEGHSRLRGNSLEMRAHLNIKSGDLGAAKADLAEALGGLKADAGHANLYVRMFQSVIEGIEAGDPAPVEAIRKEAQKVKHWSCVREADLFHVKIRFDDRRFSHLYAGTPFTAFRDDLFAQFGCRPDGEVYRYGFRASKTMDLVTGEIEGKAALNPGKQTHRLLEALLRDFYKPQKIGELFASLFAGEYYDVIRSPDRVHKVLRRARLELKELGIPVNVNETDGEYSVAFTAPFAFLVPIERRAISSEEVLLAKLRAALPGEFVTAQAIEVLGVSKATFTRFAKWALDEGKISKQGSGPATRYRLK